MEKPLALPSVSKLLVLVHDCFEINVGNTPPAMVPRKGFYAAKDLDRLTGLYKIPIGHPAVSRGLQGLINRMPASMFR